MKTQIKQTIAKLSALAFVFALVVGVAPRSDAETDDTREVQINAQVLASLQLEVDSGSVVIQVDPDVNDGSNMSGGIVTDKTTTTVNTNNLAGYKLQIQLEGQEVSTGAQLDGTGAGNDVAISSTSGATTIENNFGFALNDPNITTVTKFENVATDIAGSGLATPTNSDTEDIFYYLNVDYTVPADNYQGKVTYTAVTLP